MRLSIPTDIHIELRSTAPILTMVNGCTAKNGQRFASQGLEWFDKASVVHVIHVCVSIEGCKVLCRTPINRCKSFHVFPQQLTSTPRILSNLTTIMRLSISWLVLGLLALPTAYSCVQDGTTPRCKQGDRSMCECNGGHKVSSPTRSPNVNLRPTR